MLLECFDAMLRTIDAALPTTPPAAVPHLLAPLPLDVFGALTLECPAAYPHLRAWLPTMPTPEDQARWVGGQGEALLGQSLAFVHTLLARYRAHTTRPIDQARVLDFGCGWGRLLRLLATVVSVEQLWGVDPWPASLALCRAHGVRAHLAAAVPPGGGAGGPFDLIYAFSVFTHLSARTAHQALRVLHDVLAPTGLLLVTVRPREYWSAVDDEAVRQALWQQHDSTGFAFLPAAWMEEDGGEVPYGDASMTLPYAATQLPGWDLAGVELNLGDPYQLILVLTPTLRPRPHPAAPPAPAPAA